MPTRGSTNCLRRSPSPCPPKAYPGDPAARKAGGLLRAGRRHEHEAPDDGRRTPSKTRAQESQGSANRGRHLSPQWGKFHEGRGSHPRSPREKSLFPASTPRELLTLPASISPSLLFYHQCLAWPSPCTAGERLKGKDVGRFPRLAPNCPLKQSTREST